MWTRAELKLRAKSMLQKCFWLAVGVCLIISIFTSEFTGRLNYNSGSSGNSTLESWQGALDDYGMDYTWDGYYDGDNAIVRGVINNVRSILQNIGNVGMLSILLGIGIWVWLVSMLVSIFVGSPLQVGSKRFFMCNRETRGRFEMLLYAFKSGNFMNVVGIMLMVGVKTFLWSLLLIIPGIVKCYEYSMIPYILAENPGIQMSRAFELSREMTYGHKADIWVLDLSFILWNLLGVITCGLADIFYVNPYIAATYAELYGVLRGNVLQKGVSNTFELPGFWES